MTIEQIIPVELRPQIHDLSLLKQIIESRSRSLEVVREALSNMCAPEVGAQNVYVKYFSHPDHGVSFLFEDDGCGMTRTGNAEHPGRLDRFLNVGFSGAAGFKADRYSWKGLGSKLMLNCRRLELETWAGSPSDRVYNVQVVSPAEKLLRAQPEWPKFYVTERNPESGDRKGTRISVLGYEGGEREYTFEDLRQFIYWNTIVGMTHKLEIFPHVFLKVAARQEEIEGGYRWILKPSSNDDAWKTVLVEPPLTVTESARSGEAVAVTLKGGFTLNTADACGPGISLSKFRYNTGLRLSVLGI